MAYSIGQSLVSGQPPLLVFTVCLTAFGLTMVILAYVVGEQDVINPDVQMDWNKFFTKISLFKLCPSQNNSRSVLGGILHRTTHKSIFNVNNVLNSSHVVDESKSMSAVLSDVVNIASDEKFDTLDYTEITARVQLTLLGKIHPSSFFQVSGKMKGSLLGFTGKYATLVFNVSLSFVAPLNSSCTDERCSSLWEVCLIISVPSDLLYETKNPERCDIKVINSPDTLPTFYIDVKSSDSDSSAGFCLAMDYTQNSRLTEMLSLYLKDSHFSCNMACLYEKFYKCYKETFPERTPADAQRDCNGIWEEIKTDENKVKHQINEWSMRKLRKRGTLSLYWSKHDRSIVNLHLMHTSYFMFVMVMTLVCFSLIRGRYRHPKNSHSLEKIPLDA